MKRRIYVKMCALAAGILLATSVLILLVFNQIYNDQIERQMKDEAKYVIGILTVVEEESVQKTYFQSLQDELAVRLTLINQDGEVIYDTYGDADQMENHLDRSEVQTALDEGEGTEVRYSETLREQTRYYAVQLENNLILRMSCTYRSIFSFMISVLPMLITIYILIMGMALLWASKLTNDIIEPIYKMDLENPGTGYVYDEMVPMLNRLKKQREERQKNEKLRREFSANVSHELKTPLTSISGYAELMQSGLVQPEDVPNFAGKIYKEAARLVNLVNDIIKISGLDERKVGIEKEKINLLEVALDVKDRLEILANKSKIQINVLGKPIQVMAVRQMIDELIFNLCENGMKYNRAGGQVTIAIAAEGERAKIEVSDTGIGIPKNAQARVFERFYRVDKSHSKQTGGTGLGLAIVKHVVEYHNGDISLTSEEGKGTKIVVLL